MNAVKNNRNVKTIASKTLEKAKNLTLGIGDVCGSENDTKTCPAKTDCSCTIEVEAEACKCAITWWFYLIVVLVFLIPVLLVAVACCVMKQFCCFVKIEILLHIQDVKQTILLRLKV